MDLCITCDYCDTVVSANKIIGWLVYKLVTHCTFCIPFNLQSSLTLEPTYVSSYVKYQRFINSIAYDVSNFSQPTCLLSTQLSSCVRMDIINAYLHCSLLSFSFPSFFPFKQNAGFMILLKQTGLG